MIPERKAPGPLRGAGCPGRVSGRLFFSCLAFLAAAFPAGQGARAGSAGSVEESVRLEVSFPAARGFKNACGVAALSALAGYWQEPLGVEALFERLVSPGEETSTVELMALGREHGLWVHPFISTLEEARDYLRRGVPLAALLELGAGPFRAPHFVVLTGYDDRRPVIYFHSTWKRDSFLTPAAFDRAWSRKNRLALLVMPPEQARGTRLAPRHANQLGIYFQEAGLPGKAAGLYRRALEKEDLAVYRFNLATALAAAGETGQAEAIYRRLVEEDRYGPAFNNLAMLIMEEDPSGAESLARQGLRLDPARAAWYRETIEKARRRLEKP